MTQRYELTVQDNRGLDNYTIGQHCPSVLATTAPYMSSRYTPIVQIDLVDELRGIGFVPVLAMQSMSRLPGRTAFARTLLRFRPEEYTHGSHPNDIAEVVLINSHIGGAYKVMAGIFRVICSNGLITMSSQSDSLRVVHMGDIVNEVKLATLAIALQASSKLAVIDRMKQVQLDQPTRLGLARYAAAVRFGEDTEQNVVEGTLVQTDALLRARRREDTQHDLYTTLNVLQENVIKGGVRARGWGEPKSRAVKSIDQIVRINTALWEKSVELLASHS